VLTWVLMAAALGVLLLPLLISIRRSTELFKVRVAGGKVRFVRGRMPPSLLGDLEDVFRGSSSGRAEIRAIRQAGRAEIVASGELSAEQLQRVRNVVGTYSLQRIVGGQRPRRGRPNAR
jgi:hypothetical protein